MATINKQPKKPGFIFSVFSESRSEIENVEKHVNLKNELIDQGFSFKEVEGRYTHDNGNTVQKQSFYVQVNDKYDSNSLYDFVKTWCLNADQESFLLLNSSREAFLQPLNGGARRIGVFTSVSELEAKNVSAYTYDPKTESYFICKV